MYLRARRFASLDLDPENLDTEADSTRQRFCRSGLRAQVAANRLGRQFHELRLHKMGVLSREIYSGRVTHSNGLATCWRSESYACSVTSRRRQELELDGLPELSVAEAERIQATLTRFAQEGFETLLR
jgi:hypothetical protein